MIREVVFDQSPTPAARAALRKRLIAALHEAGELCAARDAGITDPEDWVELGALLGDASLGRASREDVTVFKSVGHAVQDLFAARAAVQAAERLGLGQVLRVRVEHVDIENQFVDFRIVDGAGESG